MDEKILKEKKLKLRKEIIVQLDNNELKEIEGGAPFSIGRCSQSMCFNTNCADWCFSNGSIYF